MKIVTLERTFTHVIIKFFSDLTPYLGLKRLDSNSVLSFLSCQHLTLSIHGNLERMNSILVINRLIQKHSLLVE